MIIICEIATIYDDRVLKTVGGALANFCRSHRLLLLLLFGPNWQGTGRETEGYRQYRDVERNE
jgi:hypothetical protein